MSKGIFSIDGNGREFLQFSDISKSFFPMKTSILDLFSSADLDVSNVLRNVDYVLRKGEVSALIGRNGSGKSVLSRIIAGLSMPIEGKIVFFRDGKKGIICLDDMHNTFDYICLSNWLVNNVVLLQSHAEDIILDLNLMEYMKWRYYTHFITLEKYSDFQSFQHACEQCFDVLDVTLEKFNKPFSSYSKGMLQKMRILEVLLEDFQYIILDESFVGIDLVSLSVCHKLIKRWRQEKKSIMVISHEDKELFRMIDRISFLSEGEMMVTDFPVKKYKELSKNSFEIRIEFFFNREENNIQKIQSIVRNVLKDKFDLPFQYVEINDDGNIVIKVGQLCLEEKFKDFDEKKFSNKILFEIGEIVNLEIRNIVFVTFDGRIIKGIHPRLSWDESYFFSRLLMEIFS